VDLLLQTLTTLTEAMAGCLARGQQLATLVLLYSGVDAIASVEAKPNESVKAYFTRWVDSYLLPTKLVNCTALELYSARCGIVHTLRPDSNLSRNGQARSVYYAWGNQSAALLDGFIAQSKKQNLIITVHVDCLLDAFRIGIRKWVDDASADHLRLKAVEAQRSRWLVNFQPTKVRGLDDSGSLERKDEEK
jgi:hypothetical protein